MDYIPRYAQPFTIAEAVQLDVSTITEEIARLQNSLLHLRDTQDVLREHIASESTTNSEVDPEIKKAFEENETVIGSQEERISILRLALTEKGISTSNHYSIASNRTSISSLSTQRSPELASSNQESDDEGGIHL